jgi:hypothetical protein
MLIGWRAARFIREERLGKSRDDEQPAARSVQASL